MNIIDIVILVVFGVCLISGMYKGFISSGMVILGFIAAWFGAQATYTMLSEAILSNSSLMNVLSNYLEAGDFLGNAQLAGATVTEALAASNTILSNAVAAVSEKLPFLADAFAQNVQLQAFESIGISTLAQYLDQTIWVAVFQLVSFIVMFFVFYALSVLVINLLSRVFRFPVLRGLDSLAGGVFGLIRGYLLVLLVMAVIPMVLNVVNIPSVTEMYESSYLVNLLGSFKIFDLEAWIRNLMV